MEDKRIEELEKNVEKIDKHLAYQTVPHINGLFAQVKDLQRRVEELEKTNKPLTPRQSKNGSRISPGFVGSPGDSKFVRIDTFRQNRDRVARGYSAKNTFSFSYRSLLISST
jgi:hypothetical protein